jgi:hypothetical protein
MKTTKAIAGSLLLFIVSLNANGEIIYIEACHPGSTWNGTVCIENGLPSLPAGLSQSDRNEKPFGGYSGGGKNNPTKPKTPEQCEKEYAACNALAQGAEESCRKEAKRVSLNYCIPMGFRGISDTLTPWGGSILDHQTGVVRAANPPYDDPEYWEASCKPGLDVGPGPEKICDGTVLVIA